MKRSIDKCAGSDCVCHQYPILRKKAATPIVLPSTERYPPIVVSREQIERSVADPIAPYRETMREMLKKSPELSELPWPTMFDDYDDKNRT